MTFLLILKIIAAVGTIATGVISVINPTGISGFTGLEVKGNARGTTEVRAVLGGFFIALGLAPLIFGLSEPMFLMLGFAYLVVGATRAASMVIDKSVVQSNIISLIVEIVLGVILVIPG